MDKQKYVEIRKDKDFLYKYFVNETNNPVPYQTFYQLFGMWLEMQGIPDQWGLSKIREYLDKKHEFKVS